MALNVWTERSGYSFGTINERTQVNQQLPVSGDTGVSYSVISGRLPPGLRLEGNRILGTPYEVARNTEFSFCIRASLNTEFADRTYKMTISGADAPEFLTEAGNLPIGPANQFFVLDQSFVDYQIEAFDFDTAAGQTLSYFIAKDSGALPPGLILTPDGRIVGFVDPVLTIKPEDGNGTYDNSYYDAVAFDFAFLSTNGYDSYVYDNVFFDYSTSERGARKLNRNYEFIITVTDGDSIATRAFKIFVVGDDYFRADNTTWLDGTGLFTADVTYLKNPIWITPSNLGIYRANNYITVPLETYDTLNITYDIALVNYDKKATTQQLAPTDNIAGGVYLTVSNDVVAPVFAEYLTFNGLTPGATSSVYQISNVSSLGNNQYRLTLSTPLEIAIPDGVAFYIGTLCTLPTGMQFDRNSSQIYGSVPYQPAITSSYKFTITATRLSEKGETAVSSRAFTMSIIGEVDSVITWNTGSNLGSINANFISTLNINASSSVPGAIVIYRLVSGKLPPGLTLNLDGEIIGKVNQYGTTGLPGLTRFFDQPPQFTPKTFTTFDGGLTTIDREFTFTIEARDQYGYSATTRAFTIAVDTPNELVYSNIRVKPFLKSDQRNMWKDFINDTNIFTPESIYRPNDPNFGLQGELSMLVYAGIETTTAAKYISAMGLNHKRKRFHFGAITKATAYNTGTTTPVYEVIYVTMIDPLEPNGKRLPSQITYLDHQTNTITVDKSNIFWSRSLNDLAIPAPVSERPDPILTVDSQGYQASDSNPGRYYPSSISNWRDRLKNWSDVDTNGNPVSFESERNYLPLWMRSIQSGTKSELGFQLAVPLCYCKVGTADDIILNIKYSGFDFKLLDYTADRYIIDSVEGLSADKYLVFRNDRITV